MPTFVGHAGSAIRKLRRLCVGCEVELSPDVGGVAKVSLLAEDEAKLGAALGFVERWIRQQQVMKFKFSSSCVFFAVSWSA